MNSQLNGVRVVDCTCFAAGPSCCKMLADWGAEVIKVEPLGGEATRHGYGRHYNPSFDCYNSNKKSLSTDLKSPEGQILIRKLLSTADVFVTNYRTSALQTLGLDYETLSTLCPGLVWAHISGFGDQGPEAHAPGFDTVAYWARSGAMADFVERGGSILLPPIAFGDISAACSLAAGVCAALYQRTATGRGEKIMVSLYGQAVYSLSNPIITIQGGDVYPRSRREPLSPLMNGFRCKDGKWIFVTCVEYERYYPAVCQVIGRVDLAKDPRYSTFPQVAQHIPEFTDILDAGFAALTQAEALQLLTKADIAHSAVSQIKDILSDPQALENQYLVDYTDRRGSCYKHAVTPVKFGDSAPAPQRPAPALGQDTVAVMTQLGYSLTEIEAMAAQGTIVVGPRDHASCPDVSF